ncbi:galactose/methyl galaxtoside transporter ATP-binding protein [Yersinia frederiksenii]|uniref:Ribose/galactose/methyl galactoside import ATP-binding protein n=1 Tax=Yersinia alsatica TaxID=2890317 RepID=A0ABY5UKX0_9GAMM|nr:sugar ABC transporter ATP-binding protein [Yersinia alsatica]OWF68583.1 D-xylose ABC transporter ATP-binding protein [Yersinia frederiksenii]UWM44129.1 sugar ABC transporter ATP-binding protein [Yersinia alsatica]CFQ51538.1 galactose/methyl galaxtoside transporter ATP-binding protein [Yersinia frederiksenii]CNI06789.1 galactose/methyl galaxtoside transporter ATP-binding protein [Yersinia frederiksenii]CNK94266.1 galactose/methyl galaxtoside transporter ATP-binding protein [Yersinia frederik
MYPYILEAEGISKQFPGVKALNKVGIKIKPGSVHALMGENGAGKSTLMKCLIGIYHPDEGTIKVKGEVVTFSDTLDALHAGIAMIHQELNLVPHMTVAENIWLGREPVHYGLVNHDLLNSKTRDLLQHLNIRLKPEMVVGELNIASQQMVEIAKAVSYDADILIMDEPTSALTEGEVFHLFAIINELKEQGKGIIYISHKMDEIFEITDEVSIFRDGMFVATDKTENLTKQSLITMMVGRELTHMFPKFNNNIGEEVLKVSALRRDGLFRDISFTVKRGEILGVAGLVGAGRSEVMESLFGMHPADSGEIFIEGLPVNIDSPSKAIEQGLAFLTEDRKKSGLFLVLSVVENMSIVNLSEYINKKGFVSHGQMAQDCMEQIKKLNIKTPTMDQIINNLSGGNQQKVLIARWLLAQPKILILDEPTRGIDVGAKSEIYRLISELANRGVAIILVSSELPEILGMSDRVMVMHGGHITGILDKQDASQEKIMALASE